MDNPRRSSRRHNSMEEPINIAEVIYLKDELNRLHEEISPQCLKHIDKMSDHVLEFEKDYKHATHVSVGGAIAGTTAAVAGVALYIFTAGLSAIISGLSLAAIAGAIVAAIGQFQKKYKENNFKKTMETELEEIQKKIGPIIDMIEKIFSRTEEILRDPTLSEHKANEIRERFSYCFEKMQLFQGDDNRGVDDRKSKALHFRGNLSQTFAEISSLLDILEEILESDVQDNSNRPAETPRPKQTDQKEFKKKTEKFIDEMKTGINHLKNIMNEIGQVRKRISLNTA